MREKLLKTKEKFMNKTTNSNADNDEMLDDYSEVLTDSHLRKPVRGKYSKSNNFSRVKIISENGDENVRMETIKVEATVNNQHELKVNIPSHLPEGKYKAVLILEIR